jgi:hypothetical protein
LNAIVRVEGRTGIVLENPEFSRACGRISQATLLICRLGAQSRAALMILSGSILPEVMSTLNRSQIRGIPRIWDPGELEEFFLH